MSKSIWGYRNARYAKITGMIVLVALVAYVAHDPVGGRNGGTWAGYGIGIVATLLTAWLAWYGVRRRRYGKHIIPLEEVLSAHVYLGVGTLILATLHTGFEFGFNLHFFSFGLLLALTISGLVGIVLYAYVPAAMTANAEGRSSSEMITEIADINREARQTGSVLDDDINRLVRRSVQYTEVGGSVWKLLTARYNDQHTEEALGGVRERAETFSAAEAEAGRKLVTLLARKVEALERFRRHIRFEAWMSIWLYLHVPMTIAFILSLIGHIIFVFYY